MISMAEQKRYSQQELRDIFQCSEDGILAIIRKLKEFGVLKAVKASEKQKDMSDLIDYDIEVADVELNDNEHFYVFTFVGVIVVAERVLKCYPKYLLSANSPSKELRQVLKVLEKYSNKEQIVRMFNDSNESSAFNLLAIFLFLLHDYYEYGLYNNTNDIIEVNGSGEILWDKTINETFAFLSNGRPVYTELQTRRKINDDYDYFTQLHKCILTRVSEKMKSADLLDLFEYTEVCLSDEELDTFGDDEHILYHIEQELNTQFNTRKQLLLKTIYAYISRKGSFFDMDSLSLFGTNSFNLVWETVCSDVMDNQLQRKLCDLRLPVKLRNNYDAKQRLIDLIEKPLWTATGKTASDTLIVLHCAAHVRGSTVTVLYSCRKLFHIRSSSIHKRKPACYCFFACYLFAVCSLFLIGQFLPCLARFRDNISEISRLAVRVVELNAEFFNKRAERSERL